MSKRGVMSNDPADIDLDKPGPEDSDGAAPRNRRLILVLAALGVLTLALLLGYVALRRTAEPPVPAAQTEPSATAPAQQAEPGEDIPLPSLDETDPLVRQLVGQLSSHPMVAAWLTTDGLIVNFVVVTMRIAEGGPPAAELKAVGPIPAFRTTKSGDTLLIDPANYRRYDLHADAIAALDARGTARLYATLKPRILEAHQRFGGREGEFDRVLERAIVTLLRVPVVDGEVALEPRGVGYAFADPRLEGLSAAQKQLLRMGPQHVRTVQGKLREIASHLGIPESRLPAPTVLSR